MAGRGRRLLLLRVRGLAQVAAQLDDLLAVAHRELHEQLDQEVLLRLAEGCDLARELVVVRRAGHAGLIVARCPAGERRRAVAWPGSASAAPTASTGRG